MYLRIMNTGQAEACLSKHGQVGAGFGKLGQVGASLNLHNAAIVFCRLCALFTIYDNMKSGLFIVDSGKNRSLFKKRVGLRLTCAQKGQ